ncbi:hypothetical protein ACFRFJ_15800 [Streptomyces hydrogenans]|uniref:hypothetical protein n=1 Tax=Streptomyces hydrogenans TaxID=1873719 RepID=UPI0036C8D96F
MDELDLDDIGPQTQNLIGLLTSALNHSLEEGADRTYLEAYGQFGLNLMPVIQIPRPMPWPEALNYINRDVSQHTLKLVTAFAFIFSELAEVHDSGSKMTTAEVLRRLALNADGPEGGQLDG